MNHPQLADWQGMRASLEAAMPETAQPQPLEMSREWEAVLIFSLGMTIALYVCWVLGIV